MPKYSMTRKVPYSVDQVFAIAADVEQYKRFLPLVKRSIVRSKEMMPDGRETMDAELSVTYKKLGIEEKLQSTVIVDKANRKISASSAQGPVKRLEAEWIITETEPGSSDITFNVDYELKSKTLQFVLSGMFDMMVRKVMGAFESRARELYGKAGAKADV